MNKFNLHKLLAALAFPFIDTKIVVSKNNLELLYRLFTS